MAIFLHNSSNCSYNYSTLIQIPMTNLKYFTIELFLNL